MPRNDLRRMAAATLVYFGGLLASLFLADWVGEFLLTIGIAAVLVGLSELVIVTFALLPISGFVIRAFDIPSDLRHRLAIGALAVLAWLLIDAVRLAVAGGGWSSVFEAHFGSAIGWMQSATLLFAVAIPAIRERRVG